MIRMIKRLIAYAKNPVIKELPWSDMDAQDLDNYLKSEGGKHLVEQLAQNEIQLARWAMHQHGNRDWSNGFASGYHKAIADLYNLTQQTNNHEQANQHDAEQSVQDLRERLNL